MKEKKKKREETPPKLFQPKDVPPIIYERDLKTLELKNKKRKEIAKKV
jgi:hypothetical protein